MVVLVGEAVFHERGTQVLYRRALRTAAVHCDVAAVPLLGQSSSGNGLENMTFIGRKRLDCVLNICSPGAAGADGADDPGVGGGGGLRAEPSEFR